MNKLLFFFGKMKISVEKNGWELSIWNFVRKILNRIYIISIFHCKDFDFDFTAKIIGYKYMTMGNNIYIGRYSWLECITQYGDNKFSPKLVIKNNVSMSDFVHIGVVDYIEIGNNVLFGSKCYITDHNHGSYSGVELSSPDEVPVKRKLNSSGKVIIKDNVWIGEHVVVLPGVTIGKGCIIGANAVVSKNIPDYSIALGIPAKVVKKWNFSLKEWERV